MDEFVLYLEFDSIRKKNKKIKDFIKATRENRGSRKYTLEIIRKKQILHETLLIFATI